MHMFITFLKGIVIGMCNVIPGVSGGTVVVIFDMYEQFLDIMSVNIKRTLKNWRFVLPLLLGMAIGVLIFSKLITVLYTNFPVQTNYCFTGLILGSIPLLAGYTFGKDKHTENADGEVQPERKQTPATIISSIICILIGFATIVAFYIIKKNMAGDSSDQVLPPFTWKLATIIFIAGLVGAFTMIIPGISGSLVMLIMGVYTIIVSAIPALFDPSTFLHALVLLLPNGIGVIIGLIGGAWLIKFLLKHFQFQTYAVILGLIAGSVINVFPGFAVIDSVGVGVGSVISLIAGATLAFFGSKSPAIKKS